MGVSDFLINLNWAFGISNKSRAGIKEAKLSMTDMHTLMEKQSTLYDKQSLKASAFYENLAEHGNKYHKDRISQEISFVDDLISESQRIRDELVNNAQHHIDLGAEVQKELQKKYGDTMKITRDMTNSAMAGFKDQINMSGSLISQYKQLQEKLDSYYKTAELGGAEQRRAQAQSLVAGEKIQSQIESITQAMIASGNITSDKAEGMADSLLQIAANASDPISAMSEFTTVVSRMNSADIGTKKYEKAAEQLASIARNAEEVGKGGVENLNAYADGMQKVISKTNRATEASDNLTDAWKTMGNRLRGLTEGPMSTLIGAIALTASVQDAAEAHTEVTRDIAQMNLQVSDSTASLIDKQSEFLSSMSEVGANTSTKLSEVQAVMNSLGRARVGDTVEELESLAEVGLEMEYAFGLSRGASTELLRSLKVVGGIGTKEIRGVGDAMAKVQGSIGLTSEEATEAASTIGTVVSQMKAMGGSVRNIEVVTEEVTKMAATFNRAGLSASEASGLINKLMDPAQVEQNALLFSRLGMSVSDAFDMMAGGGDQMAGMNEKMMKLAYDLREQYKGRPRVLQQMAEMHGMNLQMVSRLADQQEELDSMTPARLAAMEKERALTDAAAEARQGLNEQLSRLGSQLNIILHELIVPLITGVSKWLEPMVQGIMKANQGLRDATESGNALKAGLAQVAKKLISGILLVGLLSGGFLKLPRLAFSLVKVLGGGLVGRSGVLTRMSGRLGEITGKLKGLGGAGDKATKAFERQNQLLDKQKGLQDSKTQKIKAMADAFKGMKPSQLLAVGAAILMISVGVAAIVYSLSKLAAVMKDMDPMQMIAFLVGSGAMVIGILFGMSLAIKAMGTASLASWPQLLAVGAAILMIGIGVGLIIYSLSLLVQAIGDAESTFGQLAGAALMILAVIGPLVAGIVLIGIFGAATWPILLAVGGAFLMMGAGVMLAAMGIGVLLNIMSSMKADALGPMITMLGELTLQIFALSGAIWILSIGMAALAIAALAFSVAAVVMMAGAVAFAAAVVIMSTMIPFLWLLGKASDNVAENIHMMGQGMKWMGENASSAKAALQGLKEAVKGFEVPEGFVTTAGAFGALGFVAKMFGEDILNLGTGILNLGTGVEKLSANSSNLKESISNVKSSLGELKDMNIGEIKNIFVELGNATDKVAKNFDLMGNGISMMAAGLANVVQFLERMSGVLSDNNLSGLLGGFGEQVNRINNSMTPAEPAGVGVQNMVNMDRKREEALRSREGETINNSAIVERIDRTNTILSRIDSKMETIVERMSGGGGAIQSKTEVNTGRTS